MWYRSAILNPDKQPFCLDSTIHQVQIPIQINQTTPVLIEILRIDLDTMQNETISISASATRKLIKAARKIQKPSASSPLVLSYPVKKTGIYMLRKVLDETKLEVQPKRSDVIVVTCPQARVRPTGENRCRNELSNVALEVEGTPPLRIKYRTTVNGVPREASEFQSLLPEDFVSPLTKLTTNTLVQTSNENVAWAQAHIVTVPLNETLIKSGKWTYSVEEVQDAVGNIVNYIADEDEKPRSRTEHLFQTFEVHERPTIVMQGCNSRNPLRSAKGEKARMPVRFGSTAPGKKAIYGPPHTVEYIFTAEDDVLPSGDHSVTPEIKSQVLETSNKQPIISDAGLYTLKSVSTSFCLGEVFEPASCVLQHPPEPDLLLSTQNITDKCAGSPIGLRVALDLIGTPDFQVHYTEQKKGGNVEHKKKRISSLRGQIDLTPVVAGHYKYTFIGISDEVYAEKSLKDKDLVLEQDVKPSASAQFVPVGRTDTCIDDTASVDVRLQGESPWTLEYDLVQAGKRKKHQIQDIQDEYYTIVTDKLTSGGEYTLSLVSITDRQGCKEFLNQQSKINVRHERPKAYFGLIDGKRAIRTLERNQVQLPLKLTGTGPWQLGYKTPHGFESQRVHSANDFITTKEDGTYELVSVRDGICPGTIDERANRFELAWVPRPELKIGETSTLTLQGGVYVKDAVCEGEEDSFDVVLGGKCHLRTKDKQGLTWDFRYSTFRGIVRAAVQG
jgi:nucleoporin POM152